MKSVQTVWFDQTYGIDYSSRWLETKYHLFSWALSSYLLSQNFDEVELVCDQIAAEIAYDKLQLPYSSYNTVLDTIKKDAVLWGQNKLYSYSIQTEPFLHLDTDAYLFKSVPENVLNAPLFAQNFEYDHENYCRIYNDVLENCIDLSDLVKKDQFGRITAVNAGLIGGNNVQFFKNLKSVVDDFVQKNITYLRECDQGSMSVFVEQFLFTQLAKKKSIPVSYLVEKEFGPPCDYQMTNFKSLPTDCHYIHVTNYKRNHTICEQMAQRLWLESPELYERALTINRQLEATHHPISLLGPNHDSAFYRTQYILFTLGITNQPNALTNEQLTQLIASLPNAATQIVVQDVVDFEQNRAEFVALLPSLPKRWEHWWAYSRRINSLLSLPVHEYMNAPILPGQHCVRLSSEWNWAEANEFVGQTADRNLADNLIAEPSYFETLLYYYPHQQLVREQLLDILNILILDALEEPLSMSEVISVISEQILAHQPQTNLQELAETVVGRIRYFLYHGVLDVAA